MHVRNDANYGLYARAGEPAQPPDKPSRIGTILADVEGERAGLFDLVVFPALDLAMSAQSIELDLDLRAGTQAAGVCVTRDQAQGLPLAVTGDHIGG
jgi:hypothetical protein